MYFIPIQNVLSIIDFSSIIGSRFLVLVLIDLSLSTLYLSNQFEEG